MQRTTNLREQKQKQKYRQQQKNTQKFSRLIRFSGSFPPRGFSLSGGEGKPRGGPRA